MNKKILKLIKEKHIHINDKCMLDAYNQKVITNIGCTITTRVNASNEIYIAEINKGDFMLRIRKLTPLECMKLMGFTKEDYQAMREIGMSDSAIYHCAGDSIIVPCLVGLLNPFVNEEHEHIKIINDYVEKEIVNGH